MNIDHPTLTQIPQLRALWKEAFGDSDSFLDTFFATAFAPERCLCVAADGEIAAAAYWFSCGQYAYIYAVATARKHRGQGYCRTLMARIHKLLQSQGYDGCIVVPGEESLRCFYADMGYKDFGGMEEFSCTAGAPLPLRKIGSEEFATLRRQSLPEGGVVQEEENLTFLSRWAEFYAGADFLLTVTREGNTLRGLELLGNRAATPGILAALGARNGTFRTPGVAPFAMYKSLVDKKFPTYFCFAFD